MQSAVVCRSRLLSRVYLGDLQNLIQQCLDQMVPLAMSWHACARHWIERDLIAISFALVDDSLLLDRWMDQGFLRSHTTVPVCALAVGISVPRSPRHSHRSSLGPQGTPIIVVQTKADLRDDFETIKQLKQQEARPVSLQEAINVAKEAQAFRALECSGLAGQGLDALLEVAISAALAFRSGTLAHDGSQDQDNQQQHKKKCIVS